MPVKVKLKIDHKNEVISLPAIALRGLVVFPNNVIHFEVGRPQSIAAVEWAMENNTSLFLVTQKDMDQEEPKLGRPAPLRRGRGDQAGAAGLGRPGEGAGGGQVPRPPVGDGYRLSLYGRPRSSPRPCGAPSPPTACRWRRWCARSGRRLKNIWASTPGIPKDVVYTILSSDDPVFLSEYIPSNLLFKYTDKQRILNESTVLGRLETLLSVFSKENKVLSIEKEIQDKVSVQMDKNQRDYFLREQMRAISDELDEEEDTRREADGYKERIEKLLLPDEAREKLNKEADPPVQDAGQLSGGVGHPHLS